MRISISIHMDKQYWDEFYKQHGLNQDITHASTFATFCDEQLFDTPRNILDLGCGNGRDSRWFATQGHQVVAVDQCVDPDVIRCHDHHNITWVEHDFVTYQPMCPIDTCYSRFTIHSITHSEQQQLIEHVYDLLPSDGTFCVEVRTTQDPKCGQGVQTDTDTWCLDGHMRRFVNAQHFVRDMLDTGFRIRYFDQRAGLSVRGDDDPVLMRLIMLK